MNHLKKALWVLIGFVLTPLFAALFVTREMSVERQIRIERPKAEVFAFVRLLENQNKFSVWALKDPQMKKTSRGTDGQPGAVSGWESSHEDVGVGEQEIKAIEEGKRIDYELRFKKPMEATDRAYMIVESAGEKASIVKWGFNSKVAYPQNLIVKLLGVEAQLGGDFETGLFNLKKLLEKR